MFLKLILKMTLCESVLGPLKFTLQAKDATHKENAEMDDTFPRCGLSCPFFM